MSRHKIHQRRRQHIIRIQPQLLKPSPNTVHLLGIKATLNNRRHERRKLRLLPTPLIRQLHVHKVQPLERVIVLLDAAEHVRAAGAAGVALNCGVCVDDVELVAVGGHLHGVFGDDSDDGEERARGFPAFGAAAGVVVGDVALEAYDHLVLGAAAVEVSSRELGVAFGDAFVDGRVEGESHCYDLFCFNF